ncbi:MAG TPA: serine/threonine-protein kinase [Polyangiaceae bacterium]|nr:serine/threonine-protein kinase [Polyangiaceae bacterium]
MTFIAESEALATDIGRYRVVAELARGGMGNVYLAIAQGPGGFNKLVAVKELKPEFCEDETYVAMFLEEARLAARLTHPNIVQTYEVGSDGSRHFMIMEYLDGRTLYRIARHLTRYDGFPVGAHLRIIAEALIGLHYAHELCDFDGQSLQIVHRDVSPLNVFLTFDGQTKVVDFGIAKAVDSSLETRTGILKGRIAYMAPEQACGGKVDRRADVYSGGVMIWEAAAGRRLWPKMTDVEVLSHVLREGPPSLRSACPTAPAELDAICARAMARQADDRYPSAAALVEDLQAHLARRHDAMPMREIGALIGRSFEAERRKMSAMIEESIVRVRDSPQSDRLAIANRTSGTQTVSIVRAQRDDLGSLPSLLAHTPSSDPSFRLADAAASRVATDARRVAGVTAPTGRSPLMWLGATTAACVVSTAAALALTRHPGPSPSIQVLASSGESAPASIAAPARVEAELVDVSIRVTPATAQITIDGLAVRGNPYHVRVERDGKTHRIVAQADGYDPKFEDVSFSGDVMIDINLDHRSPPLRVLVTHTPPPVPAPPVRPSKVAPDGARVAAGPDPAVAPPAPVSAPATVPRELDPAGGRPPLRPIVTANPYGTP